MPEHFLFATCFSAPNIIGCMQIFKLIRNILILYGFEKIHNKVPFLNVFSIKLYFNPPQKVQIQHGNSKIYEDDKYMQCIG